MRYLVILALILSVSACGKRNKRIPVSPTVTNASSSSQSSSYPFSRGPIYSACLAAERKAASQRLCGCVQAVANGRLSANEQSKAASFFNNPQLAQDERQNGSRSFWAKYKSYASAAERTCRGA